MEDLISLELLLRAKAEGMGELEHAHNLLLGLAAGALAAGAAMVGGFAAGAIAAGKSVMEQAQSVEKLSKAYGASTESIQMWHGALMLAGDDTGAFDSALTKVSMRLGLLKVQFDATGKVSKTGAMFFKEAGISAEQLAHAKPDQLIMMIAQGLEKIQDPAMRAAVGIRTLGAGWKDILDTLEKSGGSMDDFNKKVKDSGYIMDDAMIAKAQAAERSMNLLHLQFKGITNTVGVAMLPAFDAFSNFIQTMMPTFRKIADYVGTTIIPTFLKWAEHVLPLLIAEAKKFSNWIMDVAVPQFKKMWEAIQPLIDAGKKLIESFFSQFSSGGASGATGVLESITSVIQTLAPIVKDFINFLAAHPKMLDLLIGGLAISKAMPSMGGMGGQGPAATLGTIGGAGIGAAVGKAIGGDKGGIIGALSGGFIGNVAGNAIGNAMGDGISATMKAIGPKIGNLLGNILNPVMRVVGTAAGVIFGVAFDLAAAFAFPLLIVIAGVALGVLVALILDRIKGTLQDIVINVLNWGPKANAAFWSALGSIPGIFGQIMGILGQLWSQFVKQLTRPIDFGGIFNSIKYAFRDAINAVIRAWNSLEFKLAGQNVGPIQFPSIDIKPPHVNPVSFHTGGTVPGSGDVLAMLQGGERVTSRANVSRETSLMQELLDELKAHRGILSAIAAKDLRPAVALAISSHNAKVRP